VHHPGLPRIEESELSGLDRVTNGPYVETRWQVFCDTYRQTLARFVETRPNEYPWYPATPVSEVADKMLAAIRQNGLGIMHIHGAMEVTLLKLTKSKSRKAGEKYLSGA
jgi:hypothetical protein